MQQAADVDQVVGQPATLERADEQPVLVLFASDALPLCRPFERLLAREAEERALTLVRVDVDREPEVRSLDVVMIPTVRAFRGGRIVAGFVGVRPPDAVARFLDSLRAPGDARRLVEELRAEREWREVVAALDELDYESAFERLLARAERGGAAERERVRRLMVSLFTALGADDPLCERFRRRLAALLY
ncbi:MAG TPA: tetratricopeptide repeat protein [Gaiellaceae bacterium]|nr:tetratricopeptide repeat protein [Gaiellaceae bacterium]